MGVIFDANLVWKSHIQHVCSILSSHSWALFRHYVDTTMLKIVRILRLNLLLFLLFCLNVGRDFDYCLGSASKNIQTHNINYYE